MLHWSPVLSFSLPPFFFFCSFLFRNLPCHPLGYQENLDKAVIQYILLRARWSLKLSLLTFGLLVVYFGNFRSYLKMPTTSWLNALHVCTVIRCEKLGAFIFFCEKLKAEQKSALCYCKTVCAKVVCGEKLISHVWIYLRFKKEKTHQIFPGFSEQ